MHAFPLSTTMHSILVKTRRSVKLCQLPWQPQTYGHHCRCLIGLPEHKPVLSKRPSWNRWPYPQQRPEGGIYFMDIFNISLLQPEVSTRFNKITINPVPKKSKFICLNNNHPLAQTYIIMKCFERLAMMHINLISQAAEIQCNSGSEQISSPWPY